MLSYFAGQASRSVERICEMADSATMRGRDKSKRS